MAQDAHNQSGQATGCTAAGSRLLATAAIVLALQACSHAPARETSHPIPASPPVEMQPVASPRSPAPAVREKAPVPRRRPTPSAAEPRAPVRPIAPDELTGLTEAETAEVLGAPDSRDDNVPARTWRYAGRGCDVAVIFYPDLGTLTYRSLNIELAARSGFSAPACLGEIASSRRPKA